MLPETSANTVTLAVSVAPPREAREARAHAHGSRTRPPSARSTPPPTATAVPLIESPLTPAGQAPSPQLATRAPVPEARSEQPERKPEPTRLAAIDAELALLGAAQDALQRGQPSQALQLVQEHAFRFPRGALARERLTVQTLALCGLGRKGSARQVYAPMG